nr:intradiol ring-cleavage dioxygenase [uncultured Pseudomonas sp.]
MQSLYEANLTQTVLSTLENCPDQRLKQVVNALVRHLHGFIRELEPTEQEWMAAIRFLVDTAAICDESRNEFILLSDVLGASILVDAINHRKPEGATESSVLGPFYMPGAPEYPNGADLRGAGDGETVVVSGTVTNLEGTPIANALLDVWETGPDGHYHMQKAGEKPAFDLCGRIRTDAQGRYRFCTFKPVPYPIPHDGPAGKMLIALGRHYFRPAHLHMIVSAEGYQTVVTQVFTGGSDYLDSDSVFGVKSSLVAPYLAAQGGEAAREYDLSGPYWTLEYDFVLTPEASKA